MVHSHHAQTLEMDEGQVSGNAESLPSLPVQYCPVDCGAALGICSLFLFLCKGQPILVVAQLAGG